MKKGFTLIELLAVIVILAIIALIATPIVLNIIEDSKKQSIISSAQLYVDGLTKQIVSKNMTSAFNPSSCTVSNGNISCDGTALDYTVNGKKPDSGSITFNNGVVTGYTLTFDGYTVIKDQNGIRVSTGTIFNGTIVAPGLDDTYLAIVYMDPTDLTATCNAALAAQNLNEYDTPTGITSGCMKFYVYDDRGSTYKLILDHNTTGVADWVTLEDFLAAGGNLSDWDEDYTTAEGPITANARLAEDTLGWSGNPRLITADEIAHIVGADTAISWSTTNQDSEWFYFDGIGATNYDWQAQVANSENKSRYAWLFDNMSECESEGCNIEDNNYYPYPTKDSENTVSIWGYWTSSGTATALYNVWYIDSVGGIFGDVVVSDYIGVRPVIELSKSTLGTLPTLQFNGTKVAATQSDTHKGIVYMDPTDLTETCNAALASANVNEYGTPTGVTSGCMKFYIYDDSGSTYKMILDHNTLAQIPWASYVDFTAAGGTLNKWGDPTNELGPITATSWLLNDTAGWVGNPRLITANEVAHIVGADTALGWNSSKTYVSWSADVSNNATQVSWIILDGTGTTYDTWQNNESLANAENKSRYAWLYDNTYNCEERGCSIEDNNMYIIPEDPNGRWLEYSDAAYAYWTSSGVNDTHLLYAWCVGGEFNINVVDFSDSAIPSGLRPVIELPKSLIDN